MTFRSFVSLLAVILLSGCGGPGRPADLPPLHPCTITVTQDGRPLGEATVSLVSTDSSFKWAVFAQLDASGTGKMFTQGLYPGAPEGEYKVVIAKQESVSEQVGPAVSIETESGVTTAAPSVLSVYTLVEKDYTDAETTPLSITVSKKGNNQKFDCGKPTRELLHTIEP